MHVMAIVGLPGSAIAGVPGGAAFAILAVTLVLLYRMAGVVSFAQGAVGVFGAVVFQELASSGTGFWLALAAGLLLSGAIWAVFGMVMARWFSDKSVLIRSAVTVGVSVSLASIALLVFGSNPKIFPIFLSGVQFTIGSVVVPGNTILAIALALALALTVTLLVGLTRLGVWLRAISERATTAELLGVRVGSLTVGVWAFTGIVAALAILLVAPSRTTDVADLGATSIEALGAALVANFRSVWLALVAGLAIGVFESVATASSLARYSSMIPLIVVLAVLLWSRRKEVWGEVR